MAEKYRSVKGSELDEQTNIEQLWTIGYIGDGSSKKTVRHLFSSILVQERGNDMYKTMSQDTVTRNLETIEESIGKLETDMNDRISEEVEALNKTISDTKDELNGRITEEVLTLNTRITSEVATLNKKIDAVRKELSERMDEEVETLGKRIDEEVKVLTGKIEEVDKRLDKKIDENLSALKQLVESYKQELDLRIDTLSETLNKKIDDHVSELKQLIADNYTELTLKVSKAQETADKGVKDAAAAQKSADDAQSTADKGVRDAADAQYTADLAVQKADKAQDTADEANEKADNNKVSIETLQTDVKTAQETADNAHERIEGLATVNGQSLLEGGNIDFGVSRSLFMFGKQMVTADQNGVIRLPEDMQQFIAVFCPLPLFDFHYTLDEENKTLTLDLDIFPLNAEKDRFQIWYIKENTNLPYVRRFEAMLNEAGEIQLDGTIDSIQLVFWEGGLLFDECYQFDHQSNKIIITAELDIEPDEDLFIIIATT